MVTMIDDGTKRKHFQYIRVHFFRGRRQKKKRRNEKGGGRAPNRSNNKINHPKQHKKKKTKKNKAARLGYVFRYLSHTQLSFAPGLSFLCMPMQNPPFDPRKFLPKIRWNPTPTPKKNQNQLNQSPCPNDFTLIAPYLCDK